MASQHASTVGTAGSKSSRSMAVLNTAVRHATDGFIGILDMFGYEDPKVYFANHAASALFFFFFSFFFCSGLFDLPSISNLLPFTFEIFFLKDYSRSPCGCFRYIHYFFPPIFRVSLRIFYGLFRSLL